MHPTLRRIADTTAVLAAAAAVVLTATNAPVALAGSAAPPVPNAYAEVAPLGFNPVALRITGFAGDNVLSLANIADGRFRITDAAPIQVGPGCLPAKASPGQFAVICEAPTTNSGVLLQVRVILGAGNDSFGTTSAAPLFIDGGLGDDVLDGGPAHDTLIDSTGRDTLRGNGSSDDLGSSLNGDDLPDILDGGPGPDDIYAGGGDDHLIGGYGDDTMVAAAGNDTLSGGPGQDLLAGGLGADLLLGGADDDRLAGMNYISGPVLDGSIDVLRGEAGAGDRCRMPAPTVEADVVETCEIIEG